MEFVEIPAGKFWMGWEDGLPGEGPRHPVMVDGFLIARTPVTNAEYARFVEATHVAPPPFWDNPRFSDPEQPVVGINWVEYRFFGFYLGTDGDIKCLPFARRWS